MSNSIVRLAFVASVTCSAPPVSFQISHESTVPTATSGPGSTPPTVNSQSNLVAEKYGSRTSPVASRTSGRWPASRSSSQRAAVRRSCHTMARWRGRPVRRSQATMVSRWSVMPRPATASPASRTAAPTSPSTSTTASQIWPASCSTHPGRGKCWGNSRYAEAVGSPRRSKAMARTPVVPASTAITTAMVGGAYAPPDRRTGEAAPRRRRAARRGDSTSVAATRPTTVL
jgi:hypothetical protein